MLKLLKTVTKSFREEDEGASLVEYGLLVGLIAVASLTALTLTGSSVQSLLTTIGTALNNA